MRKQRFLFGIESGGMESNDSARLGVAWLLVAVVCYLSCAAEAAAATRRVEVQRHLKRLNKQAVKSIKVATLILLNA